MEMSKRVDFVTKLKPNTIKDIVLEIPHCIELEYSIRAKNGIHLTEGDGARIFFVRNVKPAEFGGVRMTFTYTLYDYSCTLEISNQATGQLVARQDLTDFYIQKMLRLTSNEPLYAGFLMQDLMQQENIEIAEHEKKLNNIKSKQILYFGDTIDNLAKSADFSRKKANEYKQRTWF